VSVNVDAEDNSAVELMESYSSYRNSSVIMKRVWARLLADDILPSDKPFIP
jgi:hypothetical protein